MNPNLQKINKWLQRHASRIAELSLQGPADARELVMMEQEIGKSLPTDFKELYLWHNGLTSEENFGSLFFGINFFPIDRVISEYRERKTTTLSDPVLKADKGIDTSNVFNPNWIKFGFDGSHTALFLDLSPGSEGAFGQIIFIDDEYKTGIVVAQSTAQLLADFASDLENNLYHLAADALEDGNHYLEPDQKIDLVNWQFSERWKR